MIIIIETRERVPFRYGLIYTPKRASFDRDHRKRLGFVFAWGYTKKEKNNLFPLSLIGLLLFFYVKKKRPYL